MKQASGNYNEIIKQHFNTWSPVEPFRDLLLGYLGWLLLVLLSAGCHQTSNQDTSPFDTHEITTRPNYGYPEWGPHNWILFGYTPLDAQGNFKTDSTGLYLMKYGSKEKQLFLPTSQMDLTTFRWSPDGKWIVGSIHAHQIVKMSFPGKQIDTLTSQSDHHLVFPSWSPDGKTIVYTDDEPRETEGLWMVAANGQYEPRLFLHQFPMSYYPDWSPVSSREIAMIIFTNMKGHVNLALLDTLTQQIQPIAYNKAGIREPVFSPDGQKLLYYTYPTDTDEGQVWVVNRDGSGKKQLTRKGGEWPCWSPDGKYILYTRFSYIHPDQYGNGKLWIMRADGLDKHIFAD